MSFHEGAIFFQVKDPGKALMRRRHRHRQRHVGVRYTGKNSNNGTSGINGKSDKIGTDLRNGTNEHRPLESPFFVSIFFCQSVVFCWTFRVQTPANVVHATECEDTTLHWMQHTQNFSFEAQLFHMFTFHRAFAMDKG